VQPELAILDLGLPDMDGLQVLRLLQEQHPCAALILTGRDGLTDRVLGLELGADDYLVKPFEPRELVARVRSILRRYQKAAPPPNPTAPAQRASPAGTSTSGA
jgi:DNA-binding response OmpR family regulator